MSFNARPTERALIKGLVHEFILARLSHQLETFKLILFNEWALVYPHVNVLPDSARERYLEQLWTFSVRYLDMYCRMSMAKLAQRTQTLSSETVLRLSTLPNALQQEFLAQPLSQLSVVQFMDAEAQVAHEEAERKAQDGKPLVKEIEAMSNIFTGANLLLYQAGFTLREIKQSDKENRPLLEGEEESDQPTLQFIVS
ncbi:hypothetical protein C8J56DRAFT_881394 [Mycena floridula]|nr:hypothetical protein C8J56DRAFT_881394 [Mycena floridula]